VRAQLRELALLNGTVRVRIAPQPTVLSTSCSVIRSRARCMMLTQHTFGCEHRRPQLPCQTRGMFRHDHLPSGLWLVIPCACSATPASHCAVNYSGIIISTATADVGCCCLSRGPDS